MSEVTTIGLDIAKNVFDAHGADSTGRTVFTRKLSRGKLLNFVVSHPRCTVALEACGGTHDWARELQAIGHEVRLMPLARVVEWTEHYPRRRTAYLSVLHLRGVAIAAVLFFIGLRGTGGYRPLADTYPTISIVDAAAHVSNWKLASRLGRWCISLSEALVRLLGLGWLGGPFARGCQPEPPRWILVLTSDPCSSGWLWRYMSD